MSSGRHGQRIAVLCQWMFPCAVVHGLRSTNHRQKNYTVQARPATGSHASSFRELHASGIFRSCSGVHDTLITIILLGESGSGELIMQSPTADTFT